MFGKIHLMTFAFCITVNIADGREVLLANRLGEVSESQINLTEGHAC